MKPKTQAEHWETQINNVEDISDEQREKIGEKTKLQKLVFQFIDHETGKRSKPFIGNYNLLKEIVQEAYDNEEKPEPQDYILLVAVIGDEPEDTLIPGTPLISVGTFLDINTDKENV